MTRGRSCQRVFVGTEVEGEVARILDRGMIVNLSATVEGFVPLNQLGRASTTVRSVQGGRQGPTEVGIRHGRQKIILSIADIQRQRREPVEGIRGGACAQKVAKGRKTEKAEGHPRRRGREA